MVNYEIALASAGAIRFSALLKIGVSYEWAGTASGRDRPGQKRYPHLSLDLLHCPSYACESCCMALRLPLYGETWLPGFLFEAC